MVCIYLKKTKKLALQHFRRRKNVSVRLEWHFIGLPRREMDADVGGEDWTKMRRSMKKLEKRLIPEDNQENISKTE